MARVMAAAWMAVALGLTGCTTQTLYADSDKPVPEQKRENSEAAQARVSLGMKYLQSGNNELAKGNLVKALELAPESAAANYGMAYYYQTVKEHDLAHEYYQVAVNLEPDNGNIRNGFGAYLCDIGEYAKADEQFVAATKSKSYTRVAETYENMATCAKRAGNPDKAKEYFERALAHSSLRAKPLLELASMAIDVDNAEEAERYLNAFHKNYVATAESAYVGVRLANLLHDPLMMQKYGEILTNQFPASREAEQYMLDQF